jgi:hypothetical protein
MRLAILAVVAFVLSVAATSALLLRAGRATAPTLAVAADSGATGDSSAAPEHPRDSVPAAGIPADSGVPDTAARDSAGEAMPPEASASAPPAPVAAPAAPVAAPTALRVVAPDREQAFRQLARIYSAMRPNEAAGVFANLTDEEVEGVLSKLGARQAASILGSLPKERAAALSRRIIAGATPRSPTP